MNTFGTLFRLTSFGESHGPAIGGVIDGMPAGVVVDMDLLRREMARRRPGQSALTTARQEADEVELLSGVFEGRTTGAPIGFLVRNGNQHSADYDSLRDLFRPSHADYTYYNKYGLRDHRGGGRSSARETLTRCVAGAFAKMALGRLGVKVTAYTSQVGDIALPDDYTHYDLSVAETNAVRCPDAGTAARMADTTEYLLLLPHPARNIPITPMDDIAVIRNMPTLKSNICAPLFHGRNENVPTDAMITRSGATT